MARRPGTNRFFVNDVGLYHWEEIDRLAKRGNYGWNLREGNCRTGSATQCGPTRFDEPLLAYPHDGCNSITGGAFVPRSLRGDWPRRFLGDYLFADYICGDIFRLRRQPGILVDLEPDGVPEPVHHLVAVLHQDRAGDAVDLHASRADERRGQRPLLRVPAGGVRALERRRERPGRERPGAVGAVAVHAAAGVDDDRLPHLDSPVPR